MSTQKHIFRAKAVGDGEWVYGDLIHYSHPNREKVCIRSVEWPQIEHDVEEDTVGEFTGLLDKKGTDIFEGDKLFIDTPNGKIESVVEWKDGMWVFKDTERVSIILGYMFNEQLEVIGNIHDNKDLVKKGE